MVEWNESLASSGVFLASTCILGICMPFINFGVGVGVRVHRLTLKILPGVLGLF